MFLMWPLLTVLATAAAVILLPSLARSAEPDTKILARVNGDAVTSDDLQRLLADPPTSWRIQQEQGVQVPEPADVERLAVQELVHRRLLLQEARRRNFTVTEDDIDQAVLSLRRRFGDIDSFGGWMHERGLDDRSLFDAVRDGLIINRVMAELVKDVRISEEEIQKYYEAHRGELTVSEEVRLRIIVVQEEAAAEEILAALRKGESFSRLAQQRSVGQRAAQGGDTGWVDIKTLPPQLREAVAMLKVSDVGGPIQKATEEFLLVGLEGRRPLRATNLTAARPEIEQRLLAVKQKEAIRDWLADQEKKSTIEILLSPR